jgi:predicted transcriptional regulator
MRSMIEQLFGSKTRVKLLELFYGNPNRSFYVREITRKIDEQINSVRRELSNLLNVGIITSDTNNNKLYYEVNQDYEYFEPLTTIFGDAEKKGAKKKAAVAKAPAVTDTTAEEQLALKALGNVDVAIYTGQFTRDESAGVDVFIAGNVNPTQLQKFITNLETAENKEIRYTHMSFKDLQYRLQIKDRFAVTLLSAKKQILIDKHNIFDK